MIPFQIPQWRKKQIHSKFNKQDLIIAHSVSQMEAVMKQAVDYIWYHYKQTGRYAEPSLHSMDQIMDSFYHRVVTQAYHTAHHEKNEAIGKKRLAALPKGMPKSLKDLETLFRNKRYWPKIMKRSKILSDRLKKAYLGKLKKKFQSIIPKIQKNEITPENAKKALIEAWDTSKSRVETIFRTETTTYFSKTQTAFFAGDDDIIGFLFDSVRDTARTIWCRDRHGLVYRPNTKLLRQNTPACHWNCRSHLIPLANTEYNRKLLNDPKRDPENVKVAPLPPGWGS